VSLPRKEVRPFIEPEAHEKLSMMAEYKDARIAVAAARLLQRMNRAEWHEFSGLIERSGRFGKPWKAVEGKDGAGQ